MENFRLIQDALLQNAGEWWTYLAVGILCWLDGFFPPLPSESLVIAMASLSRAPDSPVLLSVLALIASVGAWLGDNTAYLIGRHLPFEKLLRGERGERLRTRAAELIHTRGPVVLLSARFIPGYRIVVNMMAGHVRLPYRRFALIDFFSTAMWCAFCLAIGLASGSLFHDHPLMGVIVGVVLGIVLGAVLERAAHWWHRRPGARTSAGATAPLPKSQG